MFTKNYKNDRVNPIFSCKYIKGLVILFGILKKISDIIIKFVYIK